MTSEGQETNERLARIDTKLDVLISQHGNLAGLVTDHETRLRALEAAQNKDDEKVTTLAGTVTDHEERLRAADRWRYALPLTTIGALLAGGASVIAAFQR